MGGAGRWRRILPLALATTATQASIVVLAPILVEIARELDASVSAVGQARAILAATAVATSFAVGALIDRLGVRPLLVWGGTLTLAGSVVTAAAPTLGLFFGAQAIAGAGVACLLSAGFAGVSAYFDPEEAPWAVGYVVASQSFAWIVGTPLIGLATDAVSWRLAYALPAVVSLVTIATCVLLLPRAGRAGALVRPRDEAGLRAVLRDRSARRWVISELVAYSAWTADLTYVGAFYVQSYGVEETTVGILLAITSAAFLVTTPLTARASVRFGQRRVVIAGALGMGALLVPLLGMPLSVWFTLALSCSLAVCAALRVTGSSTLGLGQLPERPGSMMSARTASAQLGYMVGAVAGGGVLAVAGFGTLGVVLFAGLACSALLVAKVRDPLAGAAERERLADARAGVPDLAIPD